MENQKIKNIVKHRLADLIGHVRAIKGNGNNMDVNDEFIKIYESVDEDQKVVLYNALQGAARRAIDKYASDLSPINLDKRIKSLEEKTRMIIWDTFKGGWVIKSDKGNRNNVSSNERRYD